MKKLILFALVATTFISCQKEDPVEPASENNTTQNASTVRMNFHAFFEDGIVDDAIILTIDGTMISDSLPVLSDPNNLYNTASSVEYDFVEGQLYTVNFQSASGTIDETLTDVMVYKDVSGNDEAAFQDANGNLVWLNTSPDCQLLSLFNTQGEEVMTALEIW